MRKFSILFALLFFVFAAPSKQNILAQNFQRNNGQLNINQTGSISGIVLDSLSSKPVEYATITLSRKNDPKPVTGTITDTQGKFLIEKVPFGLFCIRVSFMGYNTLSLDSVIVSPRKTSLELGTVRLSPRSLQIKGVEVTAQRNAVEFAIDKMIVNVEKTLPAAGGSVVDVLKNTPSVSVDMDGNVSLRGNSNLTILLDGRPSGVASSSMLEQIPASAIEKIEVVTNPSAKYDADGTAGIINLIMKKQQQMNWNGMFQANAGTRDNFGGSINLNFKQNQWNIFGSYDDRFSTRGMDGTIERTTILPSGSTTSNQTLSSTQRGFSHNFKLGADYSIDEKNSLNTSILYNRGGGKRNSFGTNSNTDQLENFLGGYTTDNDQGSKGESIDYSLSYKRTFDVKDRELTSDLYFSKSFNNDSTDRVIVRHNELGATSFPEKQNTYSDNSNKLFSFKTDFSTPVGETGKFESGYKGILRERYQNYNVVNFEYNTLTWTNDINQSNVFIYKEQIHAAYVMYSDNISKFKYQLGLRLEEALTKSLQQTSGSQYKKDYFSFIPSLHFSQELSEGQELKLSYSRRLNRPPLQMINPFIHYMDPQNAFAGNPYLKPEYTDSYEFGHNLMIKQSSIFTNVFYRKVHDNINSYTELRNDNVTVTTFQNISEVTSYGLEINGYTQLFKWWTLNGSYSYYGTKFDPNTPGLTNTNTSRVWNTRLTSMMALPFDLDFQFNCFYASNNVTPQGNSKGMFFSDLGLKKSLLDRRLSISLRVNDVFKAQRFKNETVGANFFSSNDFRPKSQIFTLSISYNINNFKNKQDKKPEDNTGAREYENMGQ
ncbi:MAG: TonB-dependent receptor [Bacteroidota bacterium]|nr:TonB-dependent receptor [Bacteroidota bacterium]